MSTQTAALARREASEFDVVSLANVIGNYLMYEVGWVPQDVTHDGDGNVYMHVIAFVDGAPIQQWSVKFQKHRMMQRADALVVYRRDPDLDGTRVGLDNTELVWEIAREIICLSAGLLCDPDRGV